MNVAPHDLIGECDAAYSPEMVATLVNYGNWLSDRKG
jgi:hypothetical protein